MRLAILGGGGFRVPLVYRALLADHGRGRVTHVTLHDRDASRLNAIGRVLKEQAAGATDAPQVTASLDLDEAVEGADFVFSAIRVGGLEGRACDERVALEEGSSARRRWAPVASPTGCAPSRWPSTSPGGSPPSRPMRG
jgi:6-phospho-beta-glucosidase